MSAKRLPAFAAIAALLAGCGGSGHSGAAIAPTGRTIAQFVIKVPPRGAQSAVRRPHYVSVATQSIAIAVDAAPPVDSNLNSSAPNCTSAGGTLTCTVSIDVQPGTHNFTLDAFDGLNGTGSKLSTTTLTNVTISPGVTNTQPVVLDGIVAKIKVVLASTNPTPGVSAVIAVTVQASDADGFLIVGSAPYQNPITLSDSDTSGATSLSTTTVTSPATTVSLSYNGSLALRSATISAGAPGVAGSAVTAATLQPAYATQTVSSLGTVSGGGGHGGGQCPHGSPATGCTSVYALSSDPSGVVVQRVDPTGQTTAYNTTLTTPANDTLPDSSTNLQYQFASGLGSPFTVNVQQIHDGPHQVYYNRNADSSGTVDATQLQALRRGVLARASSVRPSLAGEVHRRPQRSAAAQILSDRVYVRFRATALRQSGRTVADAIGALHAVGHELPTTNADPLTVVNVPAGTTAAAFTQALQARADVAAVYPVHKRYALSRPAVNASDPHFKLPDQWYLMADGFPNAWSYTQGVGATVAVIDTGVDLTNSDLASQVTFSESVLNGNRSANEVDKDGHGTNVAGIAAAAANNGVGFAGGGYNAKLIAIGIFDPSTGFASPSDEAIAVGDAIAHGADVINLSLGAEASFNGNADPNFSEGYDQGEYEALQAAIAAGVTVVAAAGNNRDGQDPGGDGYAHNNLDYPAAYPGVISVGASQIDDNNTGNYATASESVTSYSQSGVSLGLVAPGGAAGPDQLDGSPDSDLLHWIWGYYSTVANQPCSYGGGTLPRTATNCTALFNGTSQATPQVSAAAALLYAAAGGHGTLTPAQVAQLLESTADNINDPNQGHGRLNVYRAIAALVQDSGATYSGPQPVAHSAGQTIAFAYANSGSNRPTILDYDYPVGVPVDPTSGTFRIADVRPADAPGGYKVGVWYDANGDGVIDAGDAIGTSASACSTTARCAIGTIRLTTVSGAYALP